jgi:hypothetical protein
VAGGFGGRDAVLGEQQVDDFLGERAEGQDFGFCRRSVREGAERQGGGLDGRRNRISPLLRKPSGSLRGRSVSADTLR